MSIRTFLKQCLKRTREKQQVYVSQLKKLFSLSKEEIETLLAPYTKHECKSEQLGLFKADTG